MLKRLLVWIVVLIAVAAGVFWWQRDTAAPYVAQHFPAAKPLLAMVPGLMPAPAAPTDAANAGGTNRKGGGPVPVVLAKAEVKALPVTIEAVGTAQASASVVIHSRIDSQVVSVDVAEGAKVKEGQPLFHLDARATQAQLAATEAQIDKDQAQIEQAQLDLKRANDLLTRNAGAATTRDTAATTLKVAQAQLAVDQAQRDQIQTELSYTTITAPVSGRIGSIPVKAGATVRSADAAAMATVNEIDPMQVVFAIPQDRFAALRAAMDAGGVHINVKAGKKTASGTVSFVENTIDSTTGTVTVTASVPNPDEVLWPGAFVSVEVVLGTPTDQVAVPTAALQIGQSGPYLFVVDKDKAELRNVTVARASGTDSVVTNGVKAGEDVVVDGQLRLVDGAGVSVKQAAPSDETAAAAMTPNG